MRALWVRRTLLEVAISVLAIGAMMVLGSLLTAGDVPFYLFFIVGLGLRVPSVVHEALVPWSASLFCRRQTLPANAAGTGDWCVDLTDPGPDPRRAARAFARECLVDPKASREAFFEEALPRTLVVGVTKDNAEQLVDFLARHHATAVVRSEPSTWIVESPETRMRRLLIEMAFLVGMGSAMVAVAQFAFFQKYFIVWALILMIVPHMISLLVHVALWGREGTGVRHLDDLPAEGRDSGEWCVDLIEPGPDRLDAARFLARQYVISLQATADTFREAPVPCTIVVSTTEQEARELVENLRAVGAQAVARHEPAPTEASAGL